MSVRRDFMLRVCIPDKQLCFLWVFYTMIYKSKKKHWEYCCSPVNGIVTVTFWPEVTEMKCATLEHSCNEGSLRLRLRDRSLSMKRGSLIETMKLKVEGMVAYRVPRRSHRRGGCCSIHCACAGIHDVDAVVQTLCLSLQATNRPAHSSTWSPNHHYFTKTLHNTLHFTASKRWKNSKITTNTFLTGSWEVIL